MFSANYDAMAANIKQYQQTQPLQAEKSKYLKHIEEIVSASREVESKGLSPASLKDRVTSFNHSLEKCQVRITPEEVKIWRTSNQPLLVEAAKFLEIKNLIDGTFPENSPGCNVVIMKDDTLLATHSRGCADMSNQEPMSITQRQHFGSVSKHFTAASVIHLANHIDKLALTDDIRKHFPELPRFYFKGQEVTITVDQLLTMRSGLPNMQALAFLAGIEDQDASSEEKLHLLTSQPRMDLSASPGSEFNYCNTNYDILAKIVEIVLAQSDLPEKNLKEYADAHFFQPLGMTQTGFVDPEADVYSQTIPGYALGSDEKLTEKTSRNKTWGPCGIIGTPEDMVKWNGKCPPEILDKLSEPPVPLEEDRFSYGRGLNVGHFDNGRYKVLVHSGGIEGFMTRYFKVIDTMDDEKSFGFFISTNIERMTPPQFDHFTSTLVNTWIGKNIIPTPTLTSDTSKPEVSINHLALEKAQAIIGQYAVRGWGQNARIELRNIHEGSLGIRFMPDSENPKKDFDFSLSNESADSMVFQSISPPTARLSFNDKGFLFTDLSQGVMGIQFERVS